MFKNLRLLQWGPPEDVALDPDHAGAKPGVVTDRDALDALDGDGGRLAYWDGRGDERAGRVADGLERGLEVLEKARMDRM